MKVFNSSKMDSSMWIFTLLFIVISIGVGSMFINDMKESPFLALPFVILVIVGICSYLMVPKILMDKDKIRIKNTFVNIDLPFKNLKSVEIANKNALNVRTFGIGGVFGNFGYFNGDDTWFVTNGKNKVKLTTTNGKNYMISPENPNEFVNLIKNFI